MEIKPCINSEQPSRVNQSGIIKTNRLMMHNQSRLIQGAIVERPMTKAKHHTMKSKSSGLAISHSLPTAESEQDWSTA